MIVRWIGQGGLLVKACGKTVMIDPYLSDYVGKQNPEKHRRAPVDEALLAMQPDVLVFTHDHIDHYDPETAPVYLERAQEMLVLAPGTCWQKARQFGGSHNYVLFDRGTQWTEGEIRFTAVPAVHSDAFAIGVIIEAEGKRIYVTGDTLYSEKIFAELPEDIDVVFLPVNGVGNNRFDPDGEITREQMAAILYRYAGMIGIDTGAQAELGEFPDGGSVSGYAKKALRWAVAEGLIGGTKEGGITYLKPQGNATRAQVATILMRFVNNLVER